MAAAFSTPDEIVIERKIEFKPKVTPHELLDSVYEIEKSITWIKEGKHQRIALQFPDELMGDATAVVSKLEKSIDGQVFVLGDTSYGSCCVDEIAAQHYNADCLIHYGRSCLSPTCRLPVLYVFGQQPIVVTDCVQKILQLFEDKDSDIVLMYNTVYTHAVDDLSTSLKQHYKNLVVSHLNISGAVSNIKEDHRIDNCGDKVQMSKVTKCGRSFYHPDNKCLSNYSMIYIGAESLTLTNLILTFNKNSFYTYNPETNGARKETVNVNKMLMKRFYMIERAKDARIVGIVVGTLGVADYLQVINRLKTMIKVAGKKSYTFVVGKPNVPKLANFMEVDIYVLVACPENTLFDSSEFYKPVVTPYEMELACNRNREWTGDFVSNFRELLPGGSDFVELSGEGEKETVTDISLVTGKMRTLGQGDTPVELSSTALLPRNESLTVGVTQQADTAGEHLSSRSWKGLQQNLGETPVEKAVEGRKGIAASYTHETSDSDR